MAIAPCIQHFFIQHPTQIENFENTLYFENENPKLKIMHFGKVDLEEF